MGGRKKFAMMALLAAYEPIRFPRLCRGQADLRRQARIRVVASEQEPVSFNALLVAVGAQRDRHSFEALFRHFAPRIKAYLLRLGTSASVAEDLAQEAMLSVWRKAQLFDPVKASAATWIFTIARNLRIDAIRRERRPEIDPNDPAFVPDAEPAADTGLIRAKDEARLHDAISKLSPEQAKVVELSFFADKPHSAIAKELGLPLGTVKSRLRLAMTHIRGTVVA